MRWSLFSLAVCVIASWQVPQVEASILDKCSATLSKFFANTSQLTKQRPIASTEKILGPDNYWVEARDWFSQIKEKIKSEGREDVLSVLNLKEESLVNRFFTYGFENSVQHGIKVDGVSKDSGEKVAIGLKADLVDGGIVFSISNPQVKEFPKYLKQKFFAGGRVTLPQEQRKGYKGLGFAHFAMVDNLHELPSGSFVEWKANGKEVTTELFLKISVEEGHSLPLDN